MAIYIYDDVNPDNISKVEYNLDLSQYEVSASNMHYNIGIKTVFDETGLA
jgi:hypothetical protein